MLLKTVIKREHKSVLFCESSASQMYFELASISKNQCSTLLRTNRLVDCVHNTCVLSLIVCLGLASHYQLDSYGDMATALSLRRQTGDLELKAPGLHGEWFIHCTTVVPIIRLKYLAPVKGPRTESFSICDKTTIVYKRICLIKA